MPHADDTFFTHRVRHDVPFEPARSLPCLSALRALGCVLLAMVIAGPTASGAAGSREGRDEVLEAGQRDETLNAGTRRDTLDADEPAEVLEPGSRQEVLSPGQRDEVLSPGRRDEIP